MSTEWGKGPLSVEEYLELRRLAGMSAFSPEAARIGLLNSLCIVTAKADGQLIAMGRMVGDGGGFAQVTDVAVRPSHQRNGLGTGVMTRLMAWADSNLLRGCYISLIADPGAEDLYEHFGFQARTGMSRIAGPQG